MEKTPKNLKRQVGIIGSILTRNTLDYKNTDTTVVTGDNHEYDYLYFLSIDINRFRFRI